MYSQHHPHTFLCALLMAESKAGMYHIQVSLPLPWSGRRGRGACSVTLQCKIVEYPQLRNCCANSSTIPCLPFLWLETEQERHAKLMIRFQQSLQAACVLCTSCRVNSTRNEDTVSKTGVVLQCAGQNHMHVGSDTDIHVAVMAILLEVGTKILQRNLR